MVNLGNCTSSACRVSPPCACPLYNVYSQSLAGPRTKCSDCRIISTYRKNNSSQEIVLNHCFLGKSREPIIEGVFIAQSLLRQYSEFEF